MGLGEAVAVGAAVNGTTVGGGGVGRAAGTRVGAAVGGAVGRGVGGGVGGAVGAGVAPATVTLPRMNAWTAQWYANVPAPANVTDRLPLAKTPVSNAPVSDVAECETPPSSFVHVTVSPTFTVADAGMKEKLRIRTDALAASAERTAATTSASDATIAASANTPRGTAIRYVLRTYTRRSCASVSKPPLITLARS